MPFRLFSIAAFIFVLSGFSVVHSGCKPKPRSEARFPTSVERFSAGQQAPAITLPDLEGKMVSLQDFAGKTILINFWATWCVPCVAEMPALERLYKTFKDQNFEILAINVDPPDNREAVQKFLSDNGLTFAVVLDSDFSLPVVYGLTGFPESFFLDGTGRFLNFLDPANGKTGVRVIGDRPWDAPRFLDSIQPLLQRQEP